MKILFFKNISCIVFFALFSLYISGCDTIKSWFSDEKEAVETSYNEYRNAMLSGDIEVLRNLVAREKSQELEGEDAAMKLELARSFYPADVQITGTSVTGDAATISATSPVEGGTMHGVINMIKEDGKWKLLTENWEMRFGDSEPYTEADAPTEVARPTLFHEIHGTWTGQDDRGASEWLFLFGPGFNVYIKEPSGDWHQGQALIRWDLGVESDGSIRVPPGSSVFDIDITDSSVSNYIGKVSLGAFMLRGDVLELCFGEPGQTRRAKSFDDVSDEVTCFRLNKSEDAPSSTSQDPDMSSAERFSVRDNTENAEASGKAIVVKDGIKEVYILKTGFMSETRFNNPKRASIQFQVPAEEYSNARRIEMTLDATKTGTHFADGKNYSVFDEDKVNVGESSTGGYRAIFKFIADGGQIFPPKDSCYIEIDSPYTGHPGGVFSGRVSDCTVHSAGIDYHVSSVQFTMKGVPSR